MTTTAAAVWYDGFSVHNLDTWNCPDSCILGRPWKRERTN